MTLTEASPRQPVQRCLSHAATVKLSRRDVEDARRLLSLLSIHDGGPPVDGPLAQKSDGNRMLEGRARDILARRRARHEVFGKAMFSEPAWEMLLLLYVLESGPRQTISTLADLCAASKSTALRWIRYLEGQRLIQRESHPTDLRSAFVELTEKGRSTLELYLSGTRYESD